jgi:hypothetical protein
MKQREMQKLKEEQEFLVSDKAIKLRIIDQRNCVETAQNYMRHPQTENF